MPVVVVVSADLGDDMWPMPETSLQPPAEENASGLRVRGLTKSYQVGRAALPVLTGLDLAVASGEMVVIMGPSGSGKTTLLNCISGIDIPDAGEVVVGGTAVDYTSERETTLLRRGKIGMVFQFFNLIPSLTVRENVALPLMISNAFDGEAPTRADVVLGRLGMAERATHYPFQLSGGEMQLASIARALVTSPGIVLADEPTGNVNPAIGRRIMDSLRAAAKEQTSALLMVTHSPEHAAWADRICFLKDGAIADELAQDGDEGDVAPVYERLQELAI